MPFDSTIGGGAKSKGLDQVREKFGASPPNGKPFGAKSSTADSKDISISSTSTSITGQDTLSGGHDTMVGGAKASGDASLSVTKLGALKLPDLSSVASVGAVAPVTITGVPAASAAADAAAAKAALPAAQVDLTLIGQSIDLLTKKMGKMGGG